MLVNISFNTKLRSIQNQRKHIREKKRAEIATDVRNSLRDFRVGKCLPKTAAELAAEILE
jgi:hypothetical protein